MPKKSRRKKQGSGGRRTCSGSTGSGGTHIAGTRSKAQRAMVEAMPGRALVMSPNMASFMAGGADDDESGNDISESSPCSNPSCRSKALNTFRCPICKVAEYCSGLCRKVHRREHGRTQCRDLASQRADEMRLISEPLWERWIAHEIPMLQNMSPTEASRTPGGRKLLEKLMRFYDQTCLKMEPAGDNGFNPNPSREWIASRLSLPDPMNLTIGPAGEEDPPPPRFSPGDRVVIGPNNVAPSLSGTLGVVEYLPGSQYRPGRAALSVYAVEDPIFFPEEVLVKAGTAHCSEMESMKQVSSSDLRIGDVVLIHGLVSEGGMWMNGLEGVVSAKAHGKPKRYGVDVAGQNHGALKVVSIKASNLELLFRPEPNLVAPPLLDRKHLEKYAYTDRGGALETGSERWYAADMRAEAILSGNGLCNPNDVSVVFRKASSSESPDVDEEERACYIDMESEKHALKAKEALETFPFHADAYSLLGKCFLEGPPRMRCETTAHIMYLRALQCTKILHPLIETGVQIKWEHIYARPYIRARQGLATLFAMKGNYQKAVSEGRRLLVVNPSNRRIKIEIVHWLISAGYSRSAEEFLDEDCADEEAHDVRFAYGRVLMNFWKFQIVNEDFVSEDWHPELESSLSRARCLNSFVPEYLLGQHDPQDRITEYSQGSREEAIQYAQLARTAWRATLGAIDWLSGSARVLNDEQSTPARSLQRADPLSPLLSAQTSADPTCSVSDDDSFQSAVSRTMEETETGRGVDDKDEKSVLSTGSNLDEDAELKPPPRRTKTVHYWFDALRDDPVFASALGEWGQEHKVIISDLLKGSDPVSDAEVPMQRHLDAKSKLQVVCQRRYQSPPTYNLLAEMDTANNEKVFKSQVVHEKDGRVKGIGCGSSKKRSQVEAAKQALSNLENIRFSESSRDMQTSFFGAATPLPFAMRFQLERCILGKDVFQIRIKKPPNKKKREQESLKEGTRMQARKLLSVLITKVIPPLLSILPRFKGSNKITLSELFADEMWGAMIQLKQDICNQRAVTFDVDTVNNALSRASQILEQTSSMLGVSEDNLTCDDNELPFETTEARAKWPMAEYRCEFSPEGRLIPTGYEMINVLPDSRHVPQSRRATREGGWHVRDRFVLVKALSFHEPFATEITKWLAAKPTLCNREYCFLFDKGTGKPDCWLFSPDKFGPAHCQTRQAFLETLGDFSNVKETKVGDRIGLAFTQTLPVLKLGVDQVVAIPEITFNGYKFSDGCGVMGIGVAKEVKHAFDLVDIPGAIQIRIGGIKGMLSLKHDFPPNKIGIRPSMVKFPSNHRVLEVKRCARAKAEGNKLFSQLLLILDHLGVPDAAFLDLQTKAFAEYVLQFDSKGLEYRQKTHRSIEAEYIERVLKDQCKTNGAPFSSYELHQIKSLMTQSKMKANLRCSLYLMLGVIDEYNYLEEGQVLVGNGRIQGPVLICRSPCNFPGDIQRAEAVAGQDKGVFPLLRDAVVFSAKGSRPMPDMLSGGDLDGDEYYVISEPTLVEKVCPAAPYDYGSQSAGIEHHVNVEDILKVQVPSAPDLSSQLNVLRNYMSMGDLVSESADAWIRVADVEGAASTDASLMGDMHQFALDARKGALIMSQLQYNRMRKILASFGIPHWKQGRYDASVSTSSSIQGVLYEMWSTWIQAVHLQQRKSDPSLAGNDAYVAELEARIKIRRREANRTMHRREKEKRERRKMERGHIDTKPQCSVCYTDKDVSCCFRCNKLWLCTRHMPGHERDCTIIALESENPAMEPTPELCSFCFERALVSCPRSMTCRRRYCDKECAKLDWSSGHNNECGHDEEERCPICFEPIDCPFTLLCNHKLCHSCMRNLLFGGYGSADTDQEPDYADQESLSCPVCRSKSTAYMGVGRSFALAQGLELFQKHSLLEQHLPQFTDSQKYCQILHRIVELFKQAILEQPDVQFVHCNLGCIFMRLASMEEDQSRRREKMKEAMAMLKEAIRRESNDAKANYSLGIILLAQSNPSEAIVPLRRAVKCTAILSSGQGTKNSITDADRVILNDYRAGLHEALGLEKDSQARRLRFRVGDRVECACNNGWQEGFVSKLWFREKIWPAEQESSPYQVLLDDDTYIHAPYDHELWVKKAS